MLMRTPRYGFYRGGVLGESEYLCHWEGVGEKERGRGYNLTRVYHDHHVTTYVQIPQERSITLEREPL